MNKTFEEMFEKKFGNTFSDDSMKFLHKAVMYEGWLLHTELMNNIVNEIDSENKGE